MCVILAKFSSIAIRADIKLEIIIIPHINKHSSNINLMQTWQKY